MNRKCFPIPILVLLVLVEPLVQLSAREEPVTVDFPAAMEQLGFDPATTDGNENKDGEGNGMIDSAEMELVAAILADEAYDLSDGGGTSHASVRKAYDEALASAQKDLESLLAAYPSAPVVVAGYALAGGPGSFAAINTMCTSFGSPLQGDYGLARELDVHLAPEGDADGDGVTNRVEYGAHIQEGTAAYVTAALDPERHATGPSEGVTFWCPMRGKPCAEVDYEAAGSCSDCGMALITKAAYLERAAAREKNLKTVGIVLYNGFEVLDVYGPVEMWGYVKEFRLVTVAETAGPVNSTQGLSTTAEYTFADCPKLDIVMVPGGIGSRREVNNEALLAFIRKASAEAELTTSVCSGSALLAKAGVLDGKRATSNKLFFEFAQEQSDKVEWIEEARWVEDGAFITSSGVSAGIDMALHLIRNRFGEERARQIAIGAEYVWNDNASEDPFVRKAGGHGAPSGH